MRLILLCFLLVCFGRFIAPKTDDAKQNKHDEWAQAYEQKLLHLESLERQVEAEEALLSIGVTK